MVIIPALGVFAWFRYDAWAWERRLHELQVSGQLPTWGSMIPAAVPDADNFAMIPQLAPLRAFVSLPRREHEKQEKSGEELPLFTPITKFGQIAAANFQANYAKGTPLDFASLHSALAIAGLVKPNLEPSAAILDAVEPHRSFLGEIAQGARRSSSRLPINYDNGSEIGVISYSAFRNLALTFAVRAAALRRAGRPDEAAADVVTLLRIGRALKVEVIPDGVMLGMTFDDWAINSIWDGLVQHHWTAPNLDEFRTVIGEAETVSSLRRMFTMDALVHIRTTESYLRRENPTWGAWEDMDLAALEKREPFWGPRFAYPYLWRQSLPLLADGIVGLRDCLRIKNGMFDVKAYARWRTKFEQRRGKVPHSFVGYSFFDPEIIRSPLVRSLSVTTALRFARLACRLEKEYLLMGRYPQKLSDQDPEAIDVMSGDSLWYTVAKDGQAYRLASVGWDELESSWDKNKNPPAWIHQWSWTFPNFQGVE